MRIALTLSILLSVACSGGASSSTSTGSESPATETPTETPPADENIAEGESAGALCGTRGAAACPAGSFCDFPAGSECGATDRGGHCAPIPEMCTREFNPVCGCDGQTHPTACTANSAGVSVAHAGPC